MRRATIALLALAGVLAFGAAWAQDSSALLKAIQGEDADARAAAVEELTQVGPPVIEPLFALMGGENRAAGTAAQQAVQAMTHRAARPGAEAERKLVADALVRQAQADRLAAVRRFALRMLSFVAGDESVSALARLLRDGDVREMTRWALVRIPGAAATDALAKAADSEPDPVFRAALITSLGVRGDRHALPAVRTALDAWSSEVRVAALDALARIADPASEAALRGAMSFGSEAERVRAGAAYSRLAERLLEAGERGAAERMYERLYEGAPTPRGRGAGLIGLARVRGPDAVPMLVTALESDDAVMRDAANAALVHTRDITPAIGEALASAAEPELRVALIGVLVERGDPRAISTLIHAAESTDEDVQIAAFEALGKLRRPAAGTPLLLALNRTPGPARDAAEAALTQIPGAATTQAITHAFAKASPDVRVVLVRVLGVRRDRGATPVLLAAITDADEAVQLAAIEALESLGDPAAVPALLAMLRMAEGDLRDAAGAALEEATTKENRDVVVAALPGAPDEMRVALLRVLGRSPDRGLLPVFVGAARDANEAVVLAALEGLAQVRDEAGASVLLDVAEHGTEKTRAAAVRAYLQIADARREKDGNAALTIYKRGLEIATGDAERKLAIRGIGSIGDPDSLPLLLPFLEGGKLQAEAAAAVVPIADKLAKQGKKDEAIDLYTKAVELSTDRKVIVDAAGKLRKLGVELDIAAKAGFVGHWWVLGPFPGRKRMMEGDVIATDGPVDVAAEVQADEKTYRWQYLPVDDPQGMLNLEEDLAKKSDCGAYAYAEVTSEKARDVLFKIGSDDAVFCWLNGELIHKFTGDRGYRPDQDTVEARLAVGRNTVLMKVINNRSHWAVGLRITDRDGNPLQLEQRRP